MTSYTVEFARSGRATCAQTKCKEKIPKDEIRIGAHSEGNGMHVTKWYHAKCFNLPRKYAQGEGKITAEEFVSTVLQDTTENSAILPERAAEVAEAIAYHAPKKKPSEHTGPIAELKTQYDNMMEQKQNDDDKEPATKKSKSIQAQRVEAYGEYHKNTTGVLKDILQWNRQYYSGNKDYLLLRCIDGTVYGRLAACSLCGGHLKLNEDGVTVTCNGQFDESLSRRIPCEYKGTAEEAPRWQPWYSSEPTEEEQQEMDRLIEEARDGGAAVDLSSDAVVKLVEAAEEIQEWTLTSKAGVRAATADMIALLQESSKKVDIPDDEDQAKQKVGPVIARNKNLSAAEMVPKLVEEFGFVEDKEAKAAKKESGITDAIANPKNGPLAAAFQELAEFYVKEGNRNAGNSYTKVVNAIKDIEFEITTENAPGLAKGKNKVQGIGNASMEKMVEFLSTGTMAKLEEKRANAA